MSALTPTPPLNNTAESWSTASPNYAERVGRMCRRAAEQLVQKSHAVHPFHPQHSHVLDIGTGTGAIPCSIVRRFPGTRILATDIAPGMVAAVDAQQLPNVSTRVVDASQPNNHAGLGPSATFTHAFSTFMIMFTLTPLAVLGEMHRVLRPNGLIGLALWGSVIGPNDLWEEACRTLDPSYKLPSPFADPNAWRTCPEAEAALREVGFRDIRTEVYVVPFEFEDTAAYVRFWYGAKNPVSDRFRESFTGDQEEAKKALERVLRERYDDATSIVVETVLAIGRK